MSGSAHLALGAVNSVPVGGKFGNQVGGKFGNQVGLFRRNSISFFDGKVTIAILHPRRRSTAFSTDFCKYWTRQRGFASERRNGEDWWVHCRDARSPGQRRKSHPPLVLSTFLITQSSPDADETEKWRLEDDLLELKELQRQLQPCKNLKEKIAVLDSNKRVLGLFRGIGRPGTYIKPSVALASRALSESDIYILKCLVAVGQEHLLEWPSALRDAYAVSEKSKSKPVSGSAFGSIKEVFTRLGNAIESRSWEGPQGKFWQSMPVLVTHRDEELQYLNTVGKVNSCEREVRGEDIEARLLESLKVLVAVLVRLEKFYDSIGGIIGYQVRALELIRESEIEKQQTGSSVNGSSSPSSSSRIQFSVPLGPDLSRDKAYAMEAASWGLEGIPAMGEIFPLGGAGDRLGLVDESTGESLPVAMLPYCGRTLLEGLIRDLQAREFLYFKVFGTQQITPVAIMTSAAKKNDERVYALFERHGWFGRGKGNFRLFEQPLVPTVAAADGHWLISEPLKAVLKPGGHGVIWKLASDEGIFKWFYSKERKAAIVRQISNPVAATDCTLLALSGIGLKRKKKFGFASCERNVGTAEGVNVLMENRLEDGSLECAVTCIEYTDFNKMGILDVPVSPGSMQAQYPANTNVLYVDLPSVEHVASSQTSASLPGMIMNLKKPVEYDDQWGNKHSVKAGRLECTMQNVADAFMTKCTSKLSSGDQGKLDTYLIYNHRRKVTSSAKRRRKQGEHSLHQTPDGSFLDLTRNAFDLLTSCGVQIPQMEGNHCYIDDGPPFLIFLHPCLGPLWDVIRQKIKGGSLLSGSELQLEVAEFAWNNVQLDGSLFIHATNIMGSLEDSDEESVMQYGLRCGKCRLFDVHIKNKGVDWRCNGNIYWQNKIQRLESLEIFLEEDAEFEACSVTIEGPHKFFVPKGHRMIVTSTISGGMTSMLETLPISSSTGHGSWVWNYKLEKSGELVLTMVDL